MPDFKNEDICHAAPEHVKAIYKGITGQDLPDDMINRMQVEACKIAEEKPMEISGVSFVDSQCTCEFAIPESVLKETGKEYCVTRIACVPLKDITIPQPWSQQRLEDARRWVNESTLNSASIEAEVEGRYMAIDSFKLPRLSRTGDGKYTIGDGIHRINTAKELGISCVLAWITDCKEPPEKQHGRRAGAAQDDEKVKEAVIEQTNPLRVNSDLAQSIKDENLAIEVYEIRATAAEFFGDYETRALYEHVIKEEKEHAREFTERLDVKEKGG